MRVWSVTSKCPCWWIQTTAQRCALTPPCWMLRTNGSRWQVCLKVHLFPQKLMMWSVMHLHGFSGIRAASQPNYINGRKINALAMPVLFLARTCQNSSSKHILSHNCIRSMGGATLPGLARCRDEHPSLQDLHLIQNSMPEIKRFEIRRMEQHICDTAWRSSLCAEWDGDPMKKLNTRS